MIRIVIAAALVASLAPQASAQEQGNILQWDDLEWSAPGGGNGFTVGVRTAEAGTDPATGGRIYYALFPAGSHFDLHWHSHDEYVVVIRGPLTLRLGDQTHPLDVGSYVVIPATLNHSWTVPAGGADAVILVRRAGPADFNFVEE